MERRLRTQPLGTCISGMVIYRNVSRCKSNADDPPVWHGTQEKYQIFDQLGGRFNSEFGMEAFPHIDTIKSYCKDPAELYPQSHTLDFHNKADGHERRIATYLVENFRTVTDLEVLAYPLPWERSGHTLTFYRDSYISRKCLRPRLSCLAIGDGDVSGEKAIAAAAGHWYGSSMTAGP